VSTSVRKRDRNRASNSTAAARHQSNLSAEIHTLIIHRRPVLIPVLSAFRICARIACQRLERSSRCVVRVLITRRKRQMKEMLTKTITVRVSAEVKAEFDQIRERVDAAGFDDGAT